jgi:hypothetical protein
MWFWAAAFVVLYGLGLFARSTWPVFEPYADTLLLAALGGACFINFGRNRTLHCGLTGPLFLIAGVVAFLMEARLWEVNEDALWGLVLVGVPSRFLLNGAWLAGRALGINALDSEVHFRVDTRR